MPFTVIIRNYILYIIYNIYIYIYHGYTSVCAIVGESRVLPSAVGGGHYMSFWFESPGGSACAGSDLPPPASASLPPYICYSLHLSCFTFYFIFIFRGASDNFTVPSGGKIGRGGAT